MSICELCSTSTNNNVNITTESDGHSDTIICCDVCITTMVYRHSDVVQALKVVVAG